MQVMEIKVSFFGPIKRPWPEQSRKIEVEEGINIRKLLHILGYGESDIRRVATVINGKKVSLGTQIQAGADVRFVLLAGGG